MEEFHNDYQLNKEAGAVLSKDTSTVRKGKESLKETDNILGKHEFEKWRLLKEHEWIEQDSYIATIDKQILGIKMKATEVDVPAEVLVTGLDGFKRMVGRKRVPPQDREDSSIS